MSFKSNFSNICRTCLVENNNMKSVFSIEKLMEQQIIFSDLLMSLTSLQVFKGDGLPEQVCLQCAEEVNRAFLFRKMSEKSDGTLRQYLETCLPLSRSNVNDYVFKNEIKEFTDESHIATNDSAINDSGGEDNYDHVSDDIFPKHNPNESTNDSNNSLENKNLCKTEFESVENEHKKKMYPCKVCHTSCLGLGEYRRHMTEIHGDVFKCDICNKNFKTGNALKRHITSHDFYATNENCSQNVTSSTRVKKKRNLPRTCNICNKTFRFHSNLERHKLIHTGEKPYLCNVCGKGFAQLSYLKIHSFIHTGEKPYKCKMCEKSFAAPGTLMTHVRTHTGERPHVCKICGKDFPQSGYLSAHIRTHTGEKPVECSMCKRYSS
ncbi:hypothetical protein RN001_007981 [Aquatica leii]|uniref:Uncharacterized protein n=1 Tax=Aquatica leii TaxID=1421715 RepID=A0AAN7P3L8_9COLE|nr:hypothetical protein RN001_007981 [Aquatica leii]